MNIKKGLEISTSDFWYDLTDGGYLDPGKICLNSKDATAIKKALAILEDFKRSCESQIKGFVQ